MLEPRYRPAAGQLAWGQSARHRRLPAVQEQVGALRKGRRGAVEKVGASPSSVEASASCAATARRAHHCASSALPVARRSARGSAAALAWASLRRSQAVVSLQRPPASPASATSRTRAELATSEQVWVELVVLSLRKYGGQP